MNAVEIEIAISELAQQPFDTDEFPYEFLRAFGNKDTTLKRLRSGATNKSDVGGVLQTNNVHIAIAKPGETTQTLTALRESPATTKAKVKFILATDGDTFEAEELASGETVACEYGKFPDHFGFFLPLAGISTVKQIRDSSFDIRATSRLNRLYVELLKDNPDWATADQRHEMNHFMARLIFCFFAEDTRIFNGTDLFTATIEQMSARNSSDTHLVISEIFRAMNTKIADRETSGLRPWTDQFPYVNGGLFSGSTDVPSFSKIARSYLLHIGNLDWTQINPDIFGSMIQAVADDDERGELGMHYTSVPNILKVLNPLFLDDLRDKLGDAGDSKLKLLNLRKRMAHIRVFDPACGSGNFLVIAYKHIREIENTINKRRGEPGRKSDIPLNNFRGIELRDFSAEIARLALIIAEYQCDVRYRGQQEALIEFLPLNNQNWIASGNALQLEWESVCPSAGTSVKIYADDLFQSPLDQAEINFDNDGGEVYICGNPPYLGSKWQSKEQKADLQKIFEQRVKSWKSLDYVAGWFMKAADYCSRHTASAAFVSTNSICQGQQVPILWPLVFDTGCQIEFAHTSFKWANLAANNAGVTVAIVGISAQPKTPHRLFSITAEGETVERLCENINAYLIASKNIEVHPVSSSLCNLHNMKFGNHPYYASSLVMSASEARDLVKRDPKAKQFLRPFYGSKEFVDNSPRYCLWIQEEDVELAKLVAEIDQRINSVEVSRVAASKDSSAQKLSATPWRFREQNVGKKHTIIIPRVSSENRPFLPVGVLGKDSVVQEKAFAMYDAPLWNMSLIASRLHWVWIGTVCVRMRTDFSYSNTMGWNTFPVPKLTEKNKEDLTRCAEDILLAREAHFPATIADLYKPDDMPQDLREAHERNDEVLERIYIGRRFRNDTERLEKLFELYTKMTTDTAADTTGKKAKRGKP
ncbi:class I SAM-dependent DNA methyltransferase [Candidatus Thalassolituus haligoni]|uniref:class I SAM-dependent DNA methyltransferase n=1 Tax=Candidatus Thalassolituus haligoni TaxID=3100113 RepID=UPI0035172B94